MFSDVHLGKGAYIPYTSDLYSEITEEVDDV